jgi:dihydrofolate reductase
VLHEWAFHADDAGRQVLEDSQISVGASIAGRRTYERSIEWWQADGPGGELRTPTFIVTHSEPADIPENSVYTFVSSPEEAVKRAAGVAGAKDVDVFNARIGEQLLRSGQVNEMRVHVVPVLLGNGTRLIHDLRGRHLRLELVSASHSAMAMHLRYLVVETR